MTYTINFVSDQCTIQKMRTTNNIKQLKINKFEISIHNVHLYFELNNPKAKNEKIFFEIAKIWVPKI